MLQVNLLGKFSFDSDSQESVALPLKVQELLAFLLLFSDTPHSREYLATKLWADSQLSQSKKYLRQTLWHLQTIVESSVPLPTEPLLLITNSSIQLNPNSTLVADIQQFTDVFRQLKDKSGPALTSEEVEPLRSSVDLYQGELLSGWYQEWCILERERYRAIAMTQLDKLIRYCLANQLYDSGITYSMNVLKIDPTREKTHRHLMRLYYLSGDRTGAIRQFQFIKNLLSQELGVQPTKRTLNLHQQIVNDQGESVANLLQPYLSKNKQTLGSRENLFSTLTQLLGEMATVRNDIELIKRALNK